MLQFIETRMDYEAGLPSGRCVAIRAILLTCEGCVLDACSCTRHGQGSAVDIIPTSGYSSPLRPPHPLTQLMLVACSAHLETSLSTTIQG